MITALDRLRRVLFTGAAFLFFFTGGVLLSYVILPLVRLRPGTAAQKARRCRLLVGRSWVLFHDYMRRAAILRHDPRATRFVLPSGPFVLVSNHPTLVDVTALVAAIPDIAIVAKEAMFRSPLVGRLLHYCDHIQGGDGPFAGAAVVAGALERLAHGTPVLIFPEGTRSPRLAVGRLLPGAFEAAERAGVPLVVAFIRCDPPTLMRSDAWYAVPARAAVLSVEQLPTIRVGAGQAGEAARGLQDQYASLVGLAYPGAPGHQSPSAPLASAQESHGRA
jgi:1-acyl-sn-glycerol-3-phosphate acyltransferase